MVCNEEEDHKSPFKIGDLRPTKIAIDFGGDSVKIWDPKPKTETSS